MASIYDMADTWNAGGTTFTAIKMNVTDTASAAASLLMDLQVGGTSKFKVAKNGDVVFANGSIETAAASINLKPYGSQVLIVDPTVGVKANRQLVVEDDSSYFIGWNNGGSGNSNLRLYKDADHVLAQRNSTNAQTFRVYNTYTDGSNYERGGLTWDSNELVISTTAAGTGSARALKIGPTGNTTMYFQTNGVNRWNLSSTGHFLADSDNQYDIGASGATRPRYIYAGTAVVSAGPVVASTYVSASSIFRGETDATRLGFGASDDTHLHRDAANVFAQRNSTNAQAFRIYNTYTDGSNYERGGITWASNTCYIGTEFTGTGSSRDVKIFTSSDTAGIYFRTNAADRFYVSGSGHFLAATDNTYDIGASGDTRPRNLYMGNGVFFPEVSDIAAPSANTGVIYMRDSGGKTQFVARFPSGAVQVIATEP